MFYGCESVAYFMKEKLKLPALSHYIASLKNVFKKEKKKWCQLWGIYEIKIFKLNEQNYLLMVYFIIKSS